MSFKKMLLKLMVFALPLAVFVIAGAGPNDFLVAPYVYSVSNGHLTVAWRYRDSFSTPQKLSFAADGLHFGDVDAKLVDGVYFAELPMNSCGFGSKVTYQVPGMTEPATLDGLPCADSTQPVTFSLIADTQKHPVYTKEIAELLEKQNSSVVVIAGDLVQVGQNDQEWLDFFQAMQPLIGHRLMVPVIGNHEYWQDDTAKSWKTYFGVAPQDMHYVFDIGKARILTLNSNLETHQELIQPQIDWITDQLQHVPQGMWTFVIMHHPPYSSGNVLKLQSGILGKMEGKIETDDDEDGGDDGGAPANPGDIHKVLGSIRGKEHLYLQKYFVPIFEKYKVDFVVAGHKHIYERSFKAGVNYVNAGPAGGTMSISLVRNPYAVRPPSRERTVTNFTVDDHTVHVTTLKMSGAILDDFTVTR